jgi:Icc-related predicted phosphoesterase
MMPDSLKVLTLSDTIVPFIYSPQIRRRFEGVDLIIGCGDLAYYYLEYVLNALNVPLYYVRGNHDKVVEYSNEGQRTGPSGGIDVHRRVVLRQGLLISGIEGSLKYRPGRFQYTQSDMWWHIFRLVPRLLSNRLIHGRFLDIFITHAPPDGIHDAEDLPHQGIKAFRWFLRVFQPAYHFHGHVHIYRPDTAFVTQFGKTRVVNAFGYREFELFSGQDYLPAQVKKKSIL